ncbi:hypothetical protein [Arthrobacter sp. ES1]|nr:hypothetical protein [Arthrobacter sp. ES1]
MTMVQLSDSPAIREVATDADSRLRAALNSIESNAAGSEGT